MNLHHGGKEQLAECLVDKHSSFDNGELVIIATRQQLKECMKWNDIVTPNVVAQDHLQNAQTCAILHR